MVSLSRFVGDLALALEPGLAPLLLHRLRDGVQFWDDAGQLLYANPATCRQFGVELAVGAVADAMLANSLDLHGQPLAVAEFPIRRVQAGAEEADVLVQISQPNGDRHWLRLHAERVAAGLGDGLAWPAGVISTSVDVTARIEEENSLRELAHYDPLTRLPNRLLLADRLEQALSRSRRSGELVGVCVLDLDGFKPINDTLGHKAGDQVLQDIAQRLRDSIRMEDTAARLGGDEFVLVLERVQSTADLDLVLQRVLGAISLPCLVGGGTPVRVSASLGVTLFPDDGAEPEQLLRHADQAMYKAKEGGKNRYHLYDPTAESKRRANQTIIKRMENAMQNGQFCLYFQPLVDCREGRVVGLEALVRWNHPILGLREPAEFLPLIKDDELMVQLGEWVIGSAMAQMDDWHGQGIHLPVSINVSSCQLLRGGFEGRLLELLERWPQPLPQQLQLEIVETAALDDINSISQLIHRLRQRGVQFALDDFGTGYSTLMHLKRLEADTLKIDQAFVRDMLDDAGDLAIVQGIIGLGEAFHRGVVAEGVESIEQILLLLELGCAVMQGYAIARPMPAARVADWLQSFRADPRWQAAYSQYPLRGDFDLLLLEVYHRHWFDRLRHLPAESVESTGGAQDYTACRLSRWLEQEGRVRYGNRPEFREIDRLHRQVHRLAETWLACGAESAHDRPLVQQLEQSNRELVAALHRFRLLHAGSPA